jgi:serine/threonine protein kinase
MQKRLIHIRHPLLIQYLAVAVEEERPNIKFLVVEEYLGDISISLKSLRDKVASNTLLIQFFSEKTYMWKLIVQTLKAIQYLNESGITHGDINPMNISILFNDPGTS